MIWSILLSFTSSGNKHTLNENTDTSTAVEVSLRIKDSGSCTTTRSLPAVMECDIDQVHVLAFKNHNLSYIREATKLDQDSKSFSVSLRASNNDQDTYRLMILANAGQAIRPLLTQAANNPHQITDTEVQQLVTTTLCHSLCAQNSIPLWGEVPGPKIINNNTDDLSVKLLRSLARVCVGVGMPTRINGIYNWSGKAGDQSIPFVLQSVYLCCPNQRYAVLPLSENYDTAQGKVKVHSAIAGLCSPEESKTNFAYTEIADGHYSTQEIYCPESEIRITPTGTAGDENHLKRMALIVSGLYNGRSTSYYRLDFTTGGGRKLTDVLRNHLYLFNITNVKGQGAPTLEQAYQRTQVAMEATVLDWTANAKHISFDGEHFLSIQSKRITLQGSKDQCGYISAGSDREPSQWEMSLDGEHFTKATTVNDSYFIITKPTVADGGFLTLTTRTTTQSIHIATLTLRVGRLQFQIALTQAPDIIEWR